MSTKADNRHLYLKVIERIKEDIKMGSTLRRKSCLLNLSFQKLGVSRATLREALRILEEEHVIIRRHGVGTFVHSKPLFLSGIEQLNSVTKMIEQANMTPGTIFLSSQVLMPSEDDTKRFHLAEGQELFTLNESGQLTDSRLCIV